MVIRPLQITHRPNPVGACSQKATKEKKGFLTTPVVSVDFRDAGAPRSLACSVSLPSNPGAQKATQASPFPLWQLLDRGLHSKAATAP